MKTVTISVEDPQTLRAVEKAISVYSSSARQAVAGAIREWAKEQEKKEVRRTPLQREDVPSELREKILEFTGGMEFVLLVTKQKTMSVLDPQNTPI